MRTFEGEYYVKKEKLEAVLNIRLRFTRNGNATDLYFIKDSCIDFICTHPPYADIIKYSKGIEGDMSLLGVEEFLGEMQKVAKESLRVLKKRKNMCGNDW